MAIYTQTQIFNAQLIADSQVQQLAAVLREECPYVDRDALGHWCGINSDWWLANASLQQEDFFRLLQQLHNNEVPNIALRVARRTRLDSLGVMGYAMLSSPTLEQGLQLCSHLAERSYPYIRISIETTTEHALLGCTVLPAGQSYLQLLQEIWMVSAWKYIQELLPEGVAACASFARLSYRAPAYHWQYQQLLGCRVEFDREQTLLAIPRQWLQVPVQRGSLQAQTLYETQVQRILHQEVSRGDIVSRVKRLLLERPADCEYKLEPTAALLAMSGRSLRRYLAEAGTSFREVCTQVRMSLARDYLLNSQLTAQEIAYQLGYAQTNNFFRAFKQVHGEPPERFRKFHLSS